MHVVLTVLLLRVQYICLAGQMPFWQDDGVTRPALLVQMTGMFVDFESEIWGSISAEARDLVQQLLHPNPAKRITATQALNHSWFKGAISNTGGPAAPVVPAVVDVASQIAERLAAEAAAAEEAADCMPSLDAHVPAHHHAAAHGAGEVPYAPAAHSSHSPGASLDTDVSMGRQEYSKRPRHR
jgi:serine/threonine protein kinase